MSERRYQDPSVRWRLLFLQERALPWGVRRAAVPTPLEAGGSAQ